VEGNSAPRPPASAAISSAGQAGGDVLLTKAEPRAGDTTGRRPEGVCPRERVGTSIHTGVASFVQPRLAEGGARACGAEHQQRTRPRPSRARRRWRGPRAPVHAHDAVVVDERSAPLRPAGRPRPRWSRMASKPKVRDRAQAEDRGGWSRLDPGRVTCQRMRRRQPPAAVDPHEAS